MNHQRCRPVLTLIPVSILLSVGLYAATVGTQRPGSFGQEGVAVGSSSTGAPRVQSLRVRENVYMLTGGGGNITAEVHASGVLLVDAGRGEVSSDTLAALRTISNKPVTAIINTHLHADHTGGNDAIAKTGRTVGGGGPGGGAAQRRAAIFAHENVMTRMSGGPGATAQGLWPSETFFNDVKVLTKVFYGDSIQIIHVPNAHTDGDSLVFFRQADVISAGDIYVTTAYPHIDRDAGGNIKGVLAGLNLLLDVAIPNLRSEGGTMVIPGHGRLSDYADVAYYRDMVTIIHDRVKALVDKGQTLEQVQAAKPTADYDRRYGSTDGPWTTSMFVEAIYRNLSSPQAAAPAAGGR